MIAISTGSQGEPLSALRRMALNDHRDVELHSGDTVVFSATPIPGNERSVNETIDRIFEIGAQVITAADAPIHASGHGWQEELKLMLNLTKPRYVLPVARRPPAPPPARRACRGGRGPGRERSSAGATASRSRSTPRARGSRSATEAGMIFVDGVDIGDPDDVALRDRRALSADGVFIVVATVYAEDGSSVRRPGADLPRRPVPRGRRNEALLDESRDVVEARSTGAARDGVREPVLLQQDLHDDVAAFVYDRLRRRPMILPVVVEV